MRQSSMSYYGSWSSVVRPFFFFRKSIFSVISGP